MGLDSDSYYIGNCLPHFYEKIVLTRIVNIDIKLSKKPSALKYIIGTFCWNIENLHAEKEC